MSSHTLHYSALQWLLSSASLQLQRQFWRRRAICTFFVWHCALGCVVHYELCIVMWCALLSVMYSVCAVPRCVVRYLPFLSTGHYACNGASSYQQAWGAQPGLSPGMWGEWLQFTLYTLHSTLYTAHFTLYTLHCTFYTLHFTLYTLYFLPYTLHSTLYILHSTLNSLYFTCYMADSTC